MTDLQHAMHMGCTPMGYYQQYRPGIIEQAKTKRYPQDVLKFKSKLQKEDFCWKCKSMGIYKVTGMMDLCYEHYYEKNKYQ